MSQRVPALRFGAVTLVPDERLLVRDGQPVALTPKAFDLLVHFARNPGRLLTKEELLSAVWPDVAVEESNLAYHVFAIRKALGEASDGEKLIETVPKQGYRFVIPVRVVENDVAGSPASALPAESAPARVPAAAPAARKWVVLAAGVVLGVLAMAGFDSRGTARSPAPPPIQFLEPDWGQFGLTRTPATSTAVANSFQISPDGRDLAAGMPGEDGVTRIWVRAMGTLAPRSLPGTETSAPPLLIWSPDSGTIAYDATAAGALRKVSLAGGAPQTICDLPATAVGGSWSREGVIIVGNASGGIMRCPAGGGPAAPVTRADTSETHLFPSFLPDGRHFVYLRVSRMKAEESGVYVGALDANPASVRRLFTSGFACWYVRAVDGGPGFLVFGRDGALFAQRFDERRLELIGEAVQLAPTIGSFLDYPFVSASETTLVYRQPEPPSQLTWFNRQGAEIGRIGTPEHLSGLALSPRDDRVLVVRHTPENTADENLWLHDLADASYQRATSTLVIKRDPLWTSNDRFLYSMGGGDAGVQEQIVGRQPRLLFKGDRSDVATSASADGRLLLYTHLVDANMGTDIWLRDARASSGEGKPLIGGKYDQGQARLSPDQRFVAYVSNETGADEVYIAEMRVDPTTGTLGIGNRTPVSRTGGFAPRWRADGRELFYLRTDGSVISAEVIATNSRWIGRVERLFSVPGVSPEWDVSHDGKRFLFAVPTGPPAPYHVILNWQSMLPR